MEIGRVQAQTIAFPQAKAQTPTRAQTPEFAAISDEQSAIKEQSLRLKNDNELFGATKILERSLIALKATISIAKSGELEAGETKKAIMERVENTKYKNENLYENFPLADGSTINVRDRVNLNGGIGELAKTVDIFSRENEEALSAVKARIKNGADKLGAAAEESYKKSGIDAISPSSIVANTNIDYLKAQFAKLMG